MNFYELVVDGLEKLRLEIQAEKEHRANVEKKIRLIENRTIYTLWILALMCVFLCLNIAHQIRTEGPKIDDAPISVHFNFNLDDSWANSLLQQVTCSIRDYNVHTATRIVLSQPSQFHTRFQQWMHLWME